jgi:hypothetical protein
MPICSLSQLRIVTWIWDAQMPWPQPGQGRSGTSKGDCRDIDQAERWNLRSLWTPRQSGPLVHALPISGNEVTRLSPFTCSPSPHGKARGIEEKNATPGCPVSRSTLTFAESRLVFLVSPCKPNLTKAKGLGRDAVRARRAIPPASVHGSFGWEPARWITRAAVPRSGPSRRRVEPGRGRRGCRWPPRY